MYVVLRQRDVLGFIRHSLGFMKEGIMSIIEPSGSLSHLKNAYLETSLHARH